MVDEAFRKAAAVVEDTLIFGRHTGGHSGAAGHHRGLRSERRAFDRSSREPSSSLNQFQDFYSRHYGLREARVRVVAPDIGGSFGMKLHVYHEDMAVVGLSIMLGRPVKFVADRMESFVSDIHARDHRVSARMALQGMG